MQNPRYRFILVAAVLCPILLILSVAAPTSLSRLGAATTVPAPTNLKAVLFSSTQINLSWSKVTGTGVLYLVQRSVEGGPFVQIATTTTLSYHDTQLYEESLHTYQVQAQIGSSVSAPSAPASASTPAVNDWRQLGRDIGHSGYNPAESGTAPLVSTWNVSFGQPNTFTTVHDALVDSGRVIVSIDGSASSGNSSLQAFSLSTGASLWNYSFGSLPLSAPAISGGIVVVVRQVGGAPSDSVVSALDETYGQLKWESLMSGVTGHYYPPTIAGNQVYVQAGTSGSLRAFDLATGIPLFTQGGLEPYDQWTPAVGGGAAYTFIKGNVRSHDPATGAVRWTTPVLWSWGDSSVWGDASMRSSPVLGGGLLYVVSPYELYGINPVTQAILWSTSGNRYTTSPAYANGVVYALSSGSLHARDAQSGRWIWSFTGDRDLKHGPVVANNHVYVSSSTTVFAVNLATRTADWSATDGVGGAPGGGGLSIAGGKLFVAGEDHVLRVYTLSAGTLPNFKTPPAAPTTPAAHAAGTGRIDVSWKDASNNEAGFRIERTADGGVTWTLVTLTGAGATSISDLGLAPTSSFGYRVAAFNPAGTSAFTAVASATTHAVGDDWNMHGRNAQHTGVNSSETLKPPLTADWQATLTLGRFLEPLAVEDGRVYTTTGYSYLQDPNTAVMALDAATGATLWSVPMGTVFALSPAAAFRGKVYVQLNLGGAGNRLLCFEGSSGRILWSSFYDAQWQRYRAPTVTASSVLVSGGQSGGCYRFDPDNGQVIWFTALNGLYDEITPGFSGSTVYSQQDGWFYALSHASGTLLRTTILPGGSGNTYTPAIGASTIYALREGQLSSVDANTGAILNTVSGLTLLGGGGPTLFNNTVFNINAGALEARNASDLSLLWTFAGDGALRWSPVVAAGHVYVSSDSNLYAVNLNTHAQVATAAGGGWLQVAEGKLFACGRDGIVRAFRLQ